MDNKQSTLARIAWGICILVGIVLSLKALREPDLWWMYRTGEWMLENGQVTKADPFSYTFEGVEWINVKWLFEVLIATGKSWFGVEFVFMFQMLVTIFLLTFLYKSANLIQQYSSDQANYQSKPFAGLIIAGLLMLFTIDYRLIGRPEMTSHLMASVYLFLFWRYYYQPSKLIFALVPLQIFWTNMHEAYGMGLILMLAYLGASWLQYFYAQKTNQEAHLPKLLSMAVATAIVGVCINPRGFQMLLHPFEIFGQLDSNQYTTELASIWKAAYWETQAYLNLFFFVISLGFVLLTPWLYRQVITKETTVPAKGKGKKGATKTKTVQEAAPLNWLATNLKKYGMGNGLLCCMLFYLSTTAYRNIPFFIIAAAPILAVALEYALKKINAQKWIYPAVIGLGLVFYGSVITGKYHEWTKSRDQYGLQVLSSHNPIGAAQFIQDNNIQGRCFSDYLTSAYLLWKLQPDFKTYIDLRDLDIFTTEFFSDFAKITAMPPAFEAKDDSLNFNYVVLFRPQFTGLHQHLLNDNKYDLVFIDPVAAVYLKQNSQNEPIIEKFGFTRNGLKDNFSGLRPIQSSAVPYWLSKLFNPLYVPTDYSETNVDALAGAHYLSMQQTNLAFERAKSAIQSEATPWIGNELLGNIYNNLAFAQGTPDSLKSSYVQQASFYYGQAIEQKPDHVSAIIGKATLYMQQQDLTTAIHLYTQALEVDPNAAQAIQYMGMCYKFLANQNGLDPSYVQQWLDYMLRLDHLNPNNPLIQLEIGIAYCILNDCENSVQYLKPIMNFPGLPPEDFKSATNCLKKCGG